MSDSGAQEPTQDASKDQQASGEGQELEGEIEGQADEAVAKQVEENPLDESSIEKAGEAARAAQTANLQAAKTDDPEEKKRLLTEAANHNKTVQTLQSGTLQGAAAGGGIGLATGAGLGTVVGTAVGGVSVPSSPCGAGDSWRFASSSKIDVQQVASVPTTAVGAGVGAGVGAIKGPKYTTEGENGGEGDDKDGGQNDGKDN